MCSKKSDLQWIAFFFLTKDQKWLAYLIQFRLHARSINRKKAFEKTHVLSKCLWIYLNRQAHFLNIPLAAPWNSWFFQFYSVTKKLDTFSIGWGLEAQSEKLLANSYLCIHEFTLTAALEKIKKKKENRNKYEDIYFNLKKEPHILNTFCLEICTWNFLYF